MRPEIKLYTGRVFNPRTIDLPDDTPAIHALFHSDAPGAQPVTIISDALDQPGITEVFRDGPTVRFLGYQGERNLRVLGLPQAFASRHLERLARIVLTLQLGATITVREEKPGEFGTEIGYRIAYADEREPELLRTVRVTLPGTGAYQTAPEPTGWTIDQLITASLFWPADLLGRLAELDLAAPSQATAALMVLDQAGKVRLPAPHPAIDKEPITLRFCPGAPDRVSADAVWQTTALDALVLYGIDLDRVGRTTPRQAA